MYLKSNPVINILLCNCIFFRANHCQPHHHVFISAEILLQRQIFLRLYYSFTTLWRTYESKPHTIAFSIKNSSWLNNWKCVASPVCCSWEKFGLSRAECCVYKVLCLVCVASPTEICPLQWKAGLYRRIQPWKSLTWTEFPLLNCFLCEEFISKIIKF